MVDTVPRAHSHQRTERFDDAADLRHRDHLDFAVAQPPRVFPALKIDAIDPRGRGLGGLGGRHPDPAGEDRAKHNNPGECADAGEKRPGSRQWGPLEKPAQRRIHPNRKCGHPGFVSGSATGCESFLASRVSGVGLPLLVRCSRPGFGGGMKTRSRNYRLF